MFTDKISISIGFGRLLQWNVGAPSVCGGF